MLSMSRLQWTYIFAFVWEDDAEVRRDLRDYNLRLFLQNSYRRSEERILARKIGDPTLNKERAGVDTVRAYCRSRKLSWGEKQTAVALATNCIWTSTWTANSGYDVPG